MSGKAKLHSVTDPMQFGKVAVLMGGQSAEREVSLNSGQAILKALQDSAVDAHGIDAGDNVLALLQQENYSRVFIALHGKGGEDGTLQGALETLGLPYTGSSVLGSALAMDKIRSKHLWQGLGLPTPVFSVVDRETPAPDIKQLHFPVIVKPVCQGSSIGMAKVDSPDRLNEACDAALAFDERVLVEQWVTGAEYTTSILHEQALPVIRLETPRAFYDYDAKYHAEDTLYHCPCSLDEKDEAQLQALSLAAFRALDCSGWGRVDLMCDGSGKPWLLEANTVPGMTGHSLVPMAAKQAGLSFRQLCWRILETSL